MKQRVSEVVPPPLLEQIPPGPALAVALGRLKRAQVPGGEWGSVLVARQAQVAHDQGELLADIDAVAAAAVAEPLLAAVSQDQRLTYVSVVVGWALGWDQGYTDSQVYLAQTLVAEFPRVLDELLAGRIDHAKASAIVDVLRYLPDRALAREIAYGRLALAPTQSLARLRACLRYHVDKKDAGRRSRPGDVAHRVVCAGRLRARASGGGLSRGALAERACGPG